MSIQFWNSVGRELQAGEILCVLCVVESHGSSPGRAGFKQFVSSSGKLYGSIGGGVMEQKLIDYARTLLSEKHTKPFLKHQIHRTNIERDKSGMICSGQQTIAFYFLNPEHCPLVEEIKDTLQGQLDYFLLYDENGIFIQEHLPTQADFQFNQEGETKWSFVEKIYRRPILCIVGGGHVSLALSRCMCQLNFDVIVFDDRNALNTMVENDFAKKVVLQSYQDINDALPKNNNCYIVIMTAGYRSDKIVLKEIISRPCKFLGLLGSKEKINKLFQELLEEGFSESELSKIHAPVGLSIHSKTPEEIAVSIAAEIILLKNSKSDAL